MRGKLVTALAAVAVTALLVTNPFVADAARQITSRDIKNNTVTSQDVKNGSLRAKDFASGELPSGAPGPQGPSGADGLRIVDKGWLDSEVPASVPVLEGAFQFVGTPATTFVSPSMLVHVNAQVALGSTAGSDVDLAICVDLGDGTPQRANEFLTVHVTDRDSYAMTALFRVDEPVDATFGPCVGNGNHAAGTYNALDDNDWVNGDYIITRGPGDDSDTQARPPLTLR